MRNVRRRRSVEHVRIPSGVTITSQVKSVSQSVDQLSGFNTAYKPHWAGLITVGIALNRLLFACFDFFLRFGYNYATSCLRTLNIKPNSEWTRMSFSLQLFSVILKSGHLTGLVANEDNYRCRLWTKSY